MGNLKPNTKSRVFLTEPEFSKYQTVKAKSNRKSATSLSDRPYVHKYNFKNGKNMSIGYESFRNTLLSKNAQDEKMSSRVSTKENQMLSNIKSISHLNELLNPSNKDLENNGGYDLDMAVQLKDKDLDLQDEQLEKRLFEKDNGDSIGGLHKYLDIMFKRHLQFNTTEESEIKHRKIEDLDLDNITEHFISKKTILDKVFMSYISSKASVDQHEAQFLQRIFRDMKSTVEFYVDLSYKLRKNREEELNKNDDLIDQNNDFLNAMTAVKQMKSTENLDYYLFGIKRLTEQKYFGIMHSAKQTLKVANHELAYRQIKFLDDFYEFLVSQQKKILHNSQHIEEMETEIANLRRTLKENKVKYNDELKNMLVFSDEQKAKIGEFKSLTL